jgi:hypothetical protein
MGRIALPDGEVTEPSESQFHSPAEVVAYYAKDVEFVIGRIAELNRANPEKTFTGKFDMARNCRDRAFVRLRRCQRCLQAGFQNKGLHQYRRAISLCHRIANRLVALFAIPPSLPAGALVGVRGHKRSSISPSVKHAFPWGTHRLKAILKQRATSRTEIFIVYAAAPPPPRNTAFRMRCSTKTVGSIDQATSASAEFDVTHYE